MPAPMTSRERILCAYHLGIPDKVPVVPRVEAKYLANAGPELAERFIRTTDVIFGLDVDPDYAVYLGEEARAGFSARTEGNLRYERIDTPRGPLTRMLHVEPGMMDWAEKHFFEGPEDVHKALSIPFRIPETDLAEYRSWCERIGDEGLVLAHIPDPLCCPGLWFSPEEYLLATCATHTDLVLELLAKVRDNELAYAQALLDLGVRHFMTSGAELASQTLMAPEWFGRIVTPFDGAVVRLIREAGGTMWYHCHGKIRDICDQMADMGIHVLTPCEAPPQGNITLAQLKARIGDRVCLAGNIDDETILASGDWDAVRAHALACLRDGMPGGGYMLSGTEGGVFSPNNAQAYLVLCELRDEYGVYSASG